jgi:hypothetical protein
MKTLVLLIPATQLLDVSLLLLKLMTTMHVPKTGVIKLPEKLFTSLSIVTTITIAPLILATQLKDVSTNTKEILTVMTTTHVPKTLAETENAFMTPSNVTTTTHAPLILVTQEPVVSLFLVPQVNTMITMHVPRIGVPLNLESNTLQLNVIKDLNVLPESVILLKDVSTLESFVMITTFALKILVKMENVSLLKLNVLLALTLASRTNVIKLPENASKLLKIVMTITLVPLILVMLTLVSAEMLEKLVTMLTDVQKTLVML